MQTPLVAAWLIHLVSGRRRRATSRPHYAPPQGGSLGCQTGHDPVRHRRTLINSGGAGAASWRLAFHELYGIPADIGEFTDAGMTDPDVGRRTFEAVMHRAPEQAEFARLLERRLHYMHEAVAGSTTYRVLPGVEEMLPRLLDGGYLLGIVTGNVEAAAHIKLHRARLNRFFSFGGYGSDS